jgi:hypothetical protein
MFVLFCFLLRNVYKYIQKYVICQMLQYFF